MRIARRLASTIAAFLILAAVGVAQTNGDSSGGQNLTEHQLKLRAHALSVNQNYFNSIRVHASEFGVEPALVMAVIVVESDGDPNCVSSAGAMGLMQLMPETCVDYGVYQPYDPDSNIKGGIAMLSNHIRRYHGDLEKVLAAYNAGIRHADNGSWVRISETRHYVPKVLEIYEALKGDQDVPVYNPPVEPPPLPTEEDINATVAVPTVDLMFQSLRWASNIADPAGLAESSKLDDAAEVLLGKYQAGRLSDSNLQKSAINAVVASGRHPKHLTAFLFEAPDLSGFIAKWNKFPSPQGSVIGLSHGQGRNEQVWIVVFGTF